MRVTATLVFLRALVATNLKASFALRGAFWLQATYMVFNNLIFFSVWLFFFNAFEEVGGWRLADMAALYGVTAFAYGLCVVFGGGVRELSTTITNGDLDPYMTQPKSLLLNAVASKTYASGWGDLISGAILMGLSGFVTWQTLPLALLAPILGGLALLSSAILVQSLAFWIGPMDTLGRQVWEFTVFFSVYPASIFGGPLRVLMFTLIPAGFVGYLPADMLRDFGWPGVAAAAGGSLAYAALAVAVFHRGLRRYESGNRFGVRV